MFVRLAVSAEQILWEVSMIVNRVSGRKNQLFLIGLLIVISGITLTVYGQDIVGQDVGTPFTMPSLRATPTAGCPNSMRERLIVRERGRVMFGDDRPLNVREGPATSYEIVGQIDPGGVFIVLEGTACSARYTWYRVARGSLSGWIAEGDNGVYFVEPYPPGG